MAGKFIAVVGASGVGKDAILDLARPRLEAASRFYFPTRIVTRCNDESGQMHESVSNTEFVRRVRDDLFSLWWCTHETHYAIPDKVFDALRDNRIVIANISRRSVEEAARKFPEMEIVEIVAEPETCRKRLLIRGREDEAEIMVRQLREISNGWAAGHRVHVISNNGTLAEAADVFLATILRISDDCDSTALRA